MTKREKKVKNSFPLPPTGGGRRFISARLPKKRLQGVLTKKMPFIFYYQ
jgi:hypothetical protein